MSVANRGSGTEASTLRRGIAVLTALAEHGAEDGDGIGPTRVAEIVGCDKSQASRTLAALHSLGLVEKSAQGAYRLSWTLYGLAMHGLDQHLVRVASPILRNLAQQTGHRVYLVVLRGSDVLPLWSEAGAAGKDDLWRVGRVWPAWASASGRALLFDRPREEVVELFDTDHFPKMTAQTPRDVDELWERINADKRRGHSVGLGEFLDDTFTVGVPIHGPDRKIYSAIAVAGRPPEFESEMPRAARLAMDCATLIRGSL